MKTGAYGETARRAAGWLGLLLLPILAGCGGGQGTVSGKVMFKGKGLPGGRITFRPVDPKKNSVSVAIDPEGNYEAKLPVGDMLVAVDNRELSPSPKLEAPSGLPKIKLPPGSKTNASAAEPSPSAAQKLPGRYERISEKFYAVEKSGLKITVKGGAQTENFEVK